MNIKKVMAQATPVPLSVRDSNVQNISDFPYIITGKDGEIVAGVGGVVARHLKVDVANAALLAHWYNVGPKLLEALQAMVLDKVDGPFFHEDEHNDDSEVNVARRVIAEASEVKL